LTQEGARPPGLAEIQVQEQSDHLLNNYLANKNEDPENHLVMCYFARKCSPTIAVLTDNYFDLDHSEAEE